MNKNILAVIAGVITSLSVSFVGSLLVVFGLSKEYSIIFPQTFEGRLLWFIASIFGGLVAGFILKKKGFFSGLMSGFIFVALPFLGAIIMNAGEPTFHMLFNDLGNPINILFICSLNILLTGIAGLISGKIFSN